MTNTRNSIYRETESALASWVKEMDKKNIYINDAAIRSKAKDIFNILKAKDCQLANLNFVACHTWYNRFLRKTKLRTVKRKSDTPGKSEGITTAENFPSNLYTIHKSGLTESPDIKSAQQFCDEFQQVIRDKNYPPQLVFNVQKTHLHWKRKSKTAIILLLGGNATGDFKLKPLIISGSFHSMKCIDKKTSPILFYSCQKLCIDEEMFSNWLCNHFCTSVKSYCEQRGLEKKVLLLVEEDLACKNIIANSYLDIHMVYFPLATASIIQPMSQGLMTNFKAYYHHHTFSQLLHQTEIKEIDRIGKWWRWYNIIGVIENVCKAWASVKQNSMNVIWSELWPDVVNTSSLVHEDTHEVIKDITNLINDSHSPECMDDLVHFLSLEQPVLGKDDEDSVDVHIEEEDNYLNTEDDKRDRAETIQQAIAQIKCGLDILQRNDPVVERISHVRKIVMQNLSCYEKSLEVLDPLHVNDN